MTATSRTVLVVDDDRDVQRVLTERLENEGWRVIVEKDGDWALRTFERRPVDAVVLDILIPVISGFQVAEQIRATPRGREVGIIMMTGIYRGPRHRAEAIERYRLIDYLDKPVDLDHLVQLLKQHLGRLPPPREELQPETTERSARPDALVDERQREEKREVERAVREATQSSIRLPRKTESRKAAKAGGVAPAEAPREPGDAELRGNLKRAAFPELLARLYRRRATGGLFLLRDKVKKIVYFQGGHPTYIKSNVLDECLGRVLVRERMITEKECEESVRLMKSEKRQQGSVLIEMGVISPHNLRFALEQQLQIKLFDIFRWREAEFVFRSDVPVPSDVIALDVSTANIILDGVRRSFDDDRLRAAVTPLLGKYLHHAAEPELRYQDLELGPAEQILVEALDGTRTLKDVLVRAPANLGGERGAMALLVALTLTGVLEAKDRAAAPRPPGASPPDLVGADVPVSVEIALDDAGLAAFLAQRRDADPFTVLGLGPRAEADEIERAFALLARELHPDRFRNKPDMTARLAREAFELVTAARKELEDPARRVAIQTAWEDNIEPTPPADTRPEAAPPPFLSNPQGDDDWALATRKDGPPPDAASAALAADKFFRRGEERLRQRAFEEAESCFRHAVDHRADVGRYHAFLGWAMFCARGQTPEAADAALPVLERAVEISPGVEEPHLFLGMVYNVMDRPDLAEPEFEKAMQSNPDSAEALRELRTLHMRRSRP